MGTGGKVMVAFGIAVLLAGAHSGHGHGAAATLLSAGAAPDAAGAAALANRLAARDYGWTGSQAGCLDALWAGESGFSRFADTRVTGAGGDGPSSAVFAYGIAQARGHGTTTGGVTAPYPAPYTAGNPASLGGTSSARTQIRWGLGYIAATHQTPCDALAWKQAHGNQGY